MPHTHSAEKRLRQNEKRRLRNRAAKKAIRLQIKSFLAAVKGGGDAAAEFKLAVKKLDKAAAKRVVHPNLAARKKSQLARLLQAKPAGAK
jgi:small subunit ribosomal protein S20